MMEQMRITRTCCDARRQIQLFNMMLQEANHRIANSLQAVMALSNRETAGDDEISKRISNQMWIRISAIANVHRMLSIAEPTAMIALDDYLHGLVAGLSNIWSDHDGQRRISCLCSKQNVSADIAMRLGMIANELVTNSCKYAYDDGDCGEIRVVFSVSDGKFALLVADDGRGFDSSFETGGMGQRIVSVIAAQLESRFRYQPACRGTIAILTGPASALLAKRAIPEERSGVVPQQI